MRPAESGLFINRPTTNYVGIFGQIEATGTVEYLVLEDVIIQGADYVGGLAGGLQEGTITNSFWDVERDGLETKSGDDNFGAIGKTTDEMREIDTFTDTETEGLVTPWDFDTIRDIDGTTNGGYPFLRWQRVPSPDPDPDPEPEDDEEEPRRRRAAPEPEPEHPAPPAGFMVEPRNGLILSNHITWSESETPEISSYRLYVSTGEGSGAEDFEFWLLGEFSPDTFEFIDTGLSRISYYYVITSVDAEGLESDVTSRVYWANPGTGEYGSMDPLRWPGRIMGKPDDDASSGCFIATAAYGSPMAEEISSLRAFRDKFLVSSGVGSRLVYAYYASSPVFAETVAESGILRKVARLHLAPFAGFAGILNNMN